MWYNPDGGCGCGTPPMWLWLWCPDGGAQDGDGGFGTLMVVFRMVVVVMVVVQP